MKTLLILALLALSTTILIGQNDVFTNVECSEDPLPGFPNGLISFDLEITGLSVPHGAISSSTGLFSSDGSSRLGLVQFGIPDVNNPFLYPGVIVRLEDGQDCSTIIPGATLMLIELGSDPQVTIAIGDIPDPSASIPTLGQWALMILGLLIASLGVVAIRKRQLT